MLNSFQLELVGVTVLTALSCAIPGTLLVLRGVALMSDAISHAILLGIIVMFLCTHTLNSPLLVVGAAIAGLLRIGN